MDAELIELVVVLVKTQKTYINYLPLDKGGVLGFESVLRQATPSTTLNPFYNLEKGGHLGNRFSFPADKLLDHSQPK
jgi:hypothetical protein